ncbi:HDOD domain-containing protein [Thiolapillus sp.]
MQQQSVEHSIQERELCFLQDLTEKLASREIDLPPFPEIYARIIKALHDPDISIQDVSRIVVAAPDLCVRLLLLANSALLNRSGVKVTDLNIAVSRLGLSAVNNATVTLATKDVFDVPKGSSLSFMLNKTRMESVRVAAYSYLLAIRAGMIDEKHDAMLAGLLHNIGTHYILSCAEEFPDLVSREIIDSWGPGIGQALVSNWGFPESISSAIEKQSELLLESNEEDEDAIELRDILISAILLSRADKGVEDPDLEYSQIPACRKLGLDEESIPGILEDYTDEVASFVSALR